MSVLGPHCGERGSKNEYKERERGVGGKEIQKQENMRIWGCQEGGKRK